MARKSKRRHVQWDTVKDLGKVPDGVLAKRFGITPQGVLMARKKRGIPAFDPDRATDRAPIPVRAATAVVNAYAAIVALYTGQALFPKPGPKGKKR